MCWRRATCRVHLLRVIVARESGDCGARRGELGPWANAPLASVRRACSAHAQSITTSDSNSQPTFGARRLEAAGVEYGFGPARNVRQLLKLWQLFQAQQMQEAFHTRQVLSPRSLAHGAGTHLLCALPCCEAKAAAANKQKPELEGAGSGERCSDAWSCGGLRLRCQAAAAIAGTNSPACAPGLWARRVQRAKARSRVQACCWASSMPAPGSWSQQRAAASQLCASGRLWRFAPAGRSAGTVQLAATGAA